MWIDVPCCCATGPPAARRGGHGATLERNRAPQRRRADAADATGPPRRAELAERVADELAAALLDPLLEDVASVRLIHPDALYTSLTALAGVD